jgi:predicted TPR repeat methyltransferase
MQTGQESPAQGLVAAAAAAVARGDLDGAVDEAARLAGAGGEDAARQALGVLDTVLDTAEFHIPALTARSRLREGLGDLSGALKDAASLVIAAPQQVESHVRLAELMLAAGRLDEAVLFAYEALKLTPQDPARHLDLAGIFHAQGAFAPAEELMRTAMQLAPDEVTPVLMRMDCLMQMKRAADAIYLGHAARRSFPNDVQVLRNLGNALLLAERTDEAATVFQELLLLLPDDGYASHMLDTLKGNRPARIDPGYIRLVYDQQAAGFDASMMEQAQYRVPGLIGRALDRHMAGPGLRVLDLGCGTGLCGLILRERAFFLKGIDLSPAMIAAAAGKALYDELEENDIAVALAADTRLYDAVTAGDTVCCFGDLEPLMRQVKARLRPGGLFIFSVDAAPPGTSFALASTGRFVHGRDEVRRAATAGGFAVLGIEDQNLRLDGKTPVKGFVVALQSTGAQ